MKYQKGTFVVVPNKEHLRGRPSELQTIFMWLCVHADEDGICYPSRKTIAEEAGCGIRSVDKYILQLEQMGVIEKTFRQKPNSKEKSSNLYQINIVDECNSAPGSAPVAPPSVEKSTTPSVKKDTVTVSNTNSNQLTISNPNTILPDTRGKTSIMRVTSIYRDLFRDKYGFGPTIDYGRVGKLIKQHLENKTEMQLALLLIIFFGWRGMDGSSDVEAQKLVGATYPFAWFFSSLNQYEAYAKNVSKIDMDNAEEVRNIVARTMLKLKTN